MKRLPALVLAVLVTAVGATGAPEAGAAPCSARFTAVADETPSVPVEVAATGQSYSGHSYAATSAAPGGRAWAVGKYTVKAPWTDPKTGETTILDPYAWYPLAEMWDGRAWQQTPITPAEFGQLNDVDAVSPTDAWAVGERGSDEPLIVHWDGSTWTRVPTATVTPWHSTPVDEGFELVAVSAVAADDVWAVGNSLSPFDPPRVLHWDGVAWTDDHLAETLIADVDADTYDPYLSDVTSVGTGGTTTVFVSGRKFDETELRYHPYAVYFDGLQWSEMTVPDGPDGVDTAESALHQIAAVSPTEAWAVGRWQAASDSTSGAVAWHYQHGLWTAGRVPTTATAGVGQVDAAFGAAWVGGSQMGRTRGLFAERVGDGWRTATDRRTPTIDSLTIASTNRGWAVSGRSLFRVEVCG